MNGMKRKKLLNGFSTYGINECCCSGVKVQLCCNGYVYMVSQNRTAIVKPQEQEPVILEGTIQNCCGNYAFFSRTLSNRSDELFLYRGEQCLLPVLENFKDNVYYYEKPGSIISAANDTIILSGPLNNNREPIITLYQGKKRNEYAPSNVEWRLINRINCNTDYISYVQRLGSSYIKSPLIYKGDMISEDFGQSLNDLNFASAEFLWLKTADILYGSGSNLGNIYNGFVTLLGYAVLDNISNNAYKLYYNNTSTLLYEGYIKSINPANLHSILSVDWIAISPDDNNIKLFHKAELVYDGQKNGLDFDITKTYLFGDSYRAEIDNDNNNHVIIYYENQKIVESYFITSIKESEGLLHVQAQSNRFHVFMNGNLLYDSQYTLNQCGNRFTQQLGNVTIIIDPVFGLMTFDNQTFIRTDSLI